MHVHLHADLLPYLERYSNSVWDYMRLKYRPLSVAEAVQTLEVREPERVLSFEDTLRLVRPHQQMLEAIYRPPRPPTSVAGVQTAGFDSVPKLRRIPIKIGITSNTVFFIDSFGVPF